MKGMKSMKKAYQTTDEDLNELKSKQNVNERIEWIRRKANERNNSFYTSMKVAKDIGVAPSVLAKVESGFTKNPNLDLLQKLSGYFDVPIAAFFDEYYESPAPFTIFGSNNSKLDTMPLFRTAYQVDLSYEIASVNSDYMDSARSTLYLSPLDIEEFQEEFAFLTQKYESRLKRRKAKIESLEKLNRNKEES